MVQPCWFNRSFCKVPLVCCTQSNLGWVGSGCNLFWRLFLLWVLFSAGRLRVCLWFLDTWILPLLLCLDVCGQLDGAARWCKRGCGRSRCRIFLISLLFLLLLLAFLPFILFHLFLCLLLPLLYLAFIFSLLLLGFLLWLQSLIHQLLLLLFSAPASLFFSFASGFLCSFIFCSCCFFLPPSSFSFSPFPSFNSLSLPSTTLDVVYSLDSIDSVDSDPSSPPPRTSLPVSSVNDTEQPSLSFQRMRQVVDLCAEALGAEHRLWREPLWMESILCCSSEKPPFSSFELIVCKQRGVCVLRSWPPISSVGSASLFLQEKLKEFVSHFQGSKRRALSILRGGGGGGLYLSSGRLVSDILENTCLVTQLALQKAVSASKSPLVARFSVASACSLSANRGQLVFFSMASSQSFQASQEGFLCFQVLFLLCL